MGGCASTLREWKEEAENDDEVIKASPAAPGPPAVGLAPASYLPAPSGNGDAAVPPLPPASGGLPPGQDGAPLPWHYRNSQELSMAHLVRHPRLQPFQPLGGQFGLDAAYTPIRLLGRGGTGQTWLCSEVATGRQYALKLQQRPIPRNTVRLTYNEVTIQAATCCSSVHMSHIREVLLSPSHLALVLDFERGGSAAEFVAQQIPKVSRLDLVVDEDSARFMFRQLVMGLQHLHDNHVAHRDIKLDNTLLDGEPEPTIKLCDFQFAKYWGRPPLTRMNTHLGTAVYMAPELIENRQSHNGYDPVEVDVWAAGVWLVALLLGAFPFDNRPGVDDKMAEMQILHQEMSASWASSRFVSPYIRQLSPECLDLLNRILHVHPEQRISLEGISSHPWTLKPLPPHLEAAWQRIRRAQVALERSLAGLTPDDDLVHQRNSRIYDLVREAAAPAAQWQASYERLVRICHSSKLVDCSSVENVVRINMQPQAVAEQISERALSLLDTAPRPGTPQRFSIRLHTIPSDNYLAGMAGGAGEEEGADLAPLEPLQEQGSSGGEGAGSSGEGAGSSSEGAAAELRHLSQFAASEPTIAPF